MINNNISNTPSSLDIKGENMNSFNNEQSESSTGDSNPIGDYSKYLKDIIIPMNKKKKKKEKKKSTKMINLLSKKTKRKNYKYTKNDNIIINIFNEFKSNSSLYKKFSKFLIIEKNVKNGLYSSTMDFARDVRKTFSTIFSSFSTYSDFSKYNQALIFSEIFEKIYNSYESDCYVKNAKIIYEKISKLKKEINKIEIEKNGKNYSKEKKRGEKKKEISIEKYKEDILNNIKKLNIKQKKGILKILSNSLINKNDKNNIIEFNINKIPFNQLKQLNKYITQCINNNLINQAQKDDISNGQINDEKNENIVCDEDDNLSSFISDDEYDDYDLE